MLEHVFQPARCVLRSGMGFLINAVYSMPLQTVMESKEITIQVPKVIMEEVEITYQVPAMETKTRTVQRPKTIM